MAEFPRKTRVFTGFLLNCYTALHCELDEKPLIINPVTGAFLFVSRFQHFKIPSDVTVVIVENHENFREAELQRYLFEGLTPLFVWRYQNSNSIAEWLNLIPNHYIYFGDFDPKGVHIYISEFKNKIAGNRGSFFIPANLDALILNYGQRSLYEDQEAFLPLVRKEPEVEQLVMLMMRCRKGLAQEVLIR